MSVILGTLPSPNKTNDLLFDDPRILEMSEWFEKRGMCMQPNPKVQHQPTLCMYVSPVIRRILNPFIILIVSEENQSSYDHILIVVKHARCVLFGLLLVVLEEPALL